MRETISDVGVDLAAEQCAPNLTLIIVEDGARFIAELSKKSPTMFGDLTAQDTHKLVASPGPARSWHTSEIKRADGAPVYKDNGGPKTVVVTGAKMSRLTSTIRQDVTLGFVVVDTQAVEGLQLRQIADYAVMRGLAPSKAVEGSSLGDASILTLFDEDPKAEGLTEFDREYLSAIYRGGNGYTYDQKTKQIAQQIDRAQRN